MIFNYMLLSLLNLKYKIDFVSIDDKEKSNKVNILNVLILYLKVILIR